MVEGKDYRIRPVYVPKNAISSLFIAVSKDWKICQWIGNPRSHRGTVANRKMRWLRLKHPQAAMSTKDLDYKMLFGPVQPTPEGRMIALLDAAMKKWDAIESGVNNWERVTQCVEKLQFENPK